MAPASRPPARAAPGWPLGRRAMGSVCIPGCAREIYKICESEMDRKTQLPTIEFVYHRSHCRAAPRAPGHGSDSFVRSVKLRPLTWTDVSRIRSKRHRIQVKLQRPII